MSDFTQGDPKIIMGNDGADMVVVGGQPVMDAGFENQSQISLFTGIDWPGNYLLDSDIGSDFEDVASGAITLSSLSALEKTAKLALEADYFRNIKILISNPKSWFLDLAITLSPPGSDSSTILLTKNGVNWINQAANPANERV